MAKCTICNSRKGKRICKATATLICSICCGTTRNQDKCDNCSFYSNLGKSKDYSKVPYFEIREMKNDFQIQSIAELIERGLCIFYEGNNIDDRIAKSIIERLLDKYHFQENSIFFESGLEEAGFAFVNGHIEKNFGEIPNEVISKVLCTILRSIRRHTIGRSEYLDFTRQFFSM